MKNIDIATKNFNAGFWTDDMIKRLVKKGKLTPEEYETIVGEAYTETE